MGVCIGVQNKIYDTILAIPAASLGFASAVNVKNYLPEHTASLLWSDYYYGTVTGGERKVRCWAVHCRHQPEFRTLAQAQQNIVVRAQVVAFYEIGTAGEGKLLMQAHMSVVQQA